MAPKARTRGRLSPAAGRRRSGYILLVVLGLTTVVAALGIAFIEANSTAMPEAQNRLHSARAQYLAESGVEIAMHYLMYPPASVADGDYWTGDNGIAVDATADYCSVAVTQDATNPAMFRIASVGIALDFDGSVGGKRGILAEVLVPSESQWELTYALGGNLSSLPSGTQVDGPKCNTATSTCTLPGTNVNDYISYVHKNENFDSQLVNRTSLTSSQANTINATDMSSTNPGRVLYTPGSLTISGSVELSGTLVVPGDLILAANADLRVTPVSGFPALVVNGNVVFNGAVASRSELRTGGSVIVGGTVSGPPLLNILSEIRMRVEGATVIKGGFAPTLLNLATRELRFECNGCTQSTFKNFETNMPITILSWEEQ